ncbi:hypothetical protein DK261_30260 [Pseudomonas sp. RW409]|nr:hypothetical protein C1888_09600 [Pseudomonas sp. GW531-T4]PWY36755.1 hypothetical protein DK261_30260 [Pseudomonas sp. RW409]
MPQNSQILGVNSVTNIELDKGVMPAPIIRNADWFEKIACPPICPRPGVRELARLCVARRACMRIRSLFPTLYRIVANCRFTRLRAPWSL